MKGYKLDRTLYIFDAEPAVIPVSVDDVDVIYVQQELLAAYVNDNPEAASKIKPYNYKLIAVNKLPWADYVDNDLVEEGGGGGDEQELPAVGTSYYLYEYPTPDTYRYDEILFFNGEYTGQIETDLPTDGTYVWGTVYPLEGNSDSKPIFILRSDFQTAAPNVMIPIKTLASNDSTTTVDYGQFDLHISIDEGMTTYKFTAYDDAEGTNENYSAAYIYNPIPDATGFPNYSNYGVGSVFWDKQPEGDRIYELAMNLDDVSKVDTNEMVSLYTLDDENEELIATFPYVKLETYN